MEKKLSLLSTWVRCIPVFALAVVLAHVTNAGIAGSTLSGTAMTGTQPLTNATVRLWQVNTQTYGGAVTLAGSTVTNGSGAWTIPVINCSPYNIDVYVIARSNMGSGPVRVSAFLGPCNTLPSNVVINEVTSIATIWPLAQFTAVNNGAIGAPPTNSLGLINAGLNAANLVDVTTGSSPGSGLPAGTTIPTSTINTLADIMASCDVAGGGSAACTNLFNAATPPGQDPPPDSLSAMLYLALFPTNNVAELFSLIAPTPPFTPALASAPTDWSLVINFASAGLSTPSQLSVDSSGNVWVANFGNSTIAKFSPAGQLLSGAGFAGGGLDLPFGLAIDSNGNVWASNQGNNSLSEFASDGTALSPILGFAGGGLETPQYIAVDTTNRIWVANCGDFCDGSGNPSTVSIFSSTGVAITPPTGITGGGLNGATGIAINGLGVAWVVNQGNDSLTRINAQGIVLSPSSGDTGGGLSLSVDIAFSPADYAWITDQLASAVSEFRIGGVPQTGPAGITGGGINGPLGIAIDSAGTKWIANSVGLAEIDHTAAVLSPSNGFVDPNRSAPDNVALDASGNIWVTNIFNNSLSLYLGLARPTKTPVIALPALP
jgi:sugar lactone lactonase YvrE